MALSESAKIDLRIVCLQIAAENRPAGTPAGLLLNEAEFLYLWALKGPREKPKISVVE
jgi:hypothetical protein